MAKFKNAFSNKHMNTLKCCITFVNIKKQNEPTLKMEIKKED